MGIPEVAALDSRRDLRDEPGRAARRPRPARGPARRRACSSARYARRHHDRGAAGARAHRAAARPRRAIPRAVAARRVGHQFAVGASIITGIGVVSGVECVLIANDPTVAAARSTRTRCARRCAPWRSPASNRLPVINLIESGGADLPNQADLSSPPGRIFRELTELSAAGVPTIAWCSATPPRAAPTCRACATTSSWSTARRKVFLGGPPLVKMATGEERRRRGARRRRDARAHLGARRLLRRDEQRRHPARPRDRRRTATGASWARARRCPADEPLYDPDELLGIASADVRRCRSTRAR